MAKKLQMIILVVCLGLSMIAPFVPAQKQTESQQVVAVRWTMNGPKPGVGG